MSDFVEKTFNVRGRSITAKAWHEPNKKPLLALHGWLDNASSFDLIAPHLKDFYIVALDFPGHGHSDHFPEGTRYAFLDYVDDVYAVIKQLNWNQFYLMGHSMGAGVSIALAGACPEMIKKMVLIEGFGPLSSPPEETVNILRFALDEWDSFNEQPRTFSDISVAIRARQGGMMPLSEKAARILCERGVREVEGGLAWSTDKRLRLRSASRFTEDQVIQLVRNISAETLLIRGETGIPFDSDLYGKRLAEMKHLKQITLPGRHHLHLDESPDAVAYEVAHFLS